MQENLDQEILFTEEGFNPENDFDVYLDSYAHAVKDWNDFLKHYGTPRHSGRYPWGSGENPYQRTGDWLSRYNQLRDAGLTESQIADALGIYNEKGEISTTKLRAFKTIATDYRKSYQLEAIKSMKGDGLSNGEIAKRLGLAGESTVRGMLKDNYQQNRDLASKAADELRRIIDESNGQLIDVGKNAELQLGISSTKMDVVLEMLKAEGYEIRVGRIPQATNPDQMTTLKVIGPPGIPKNAIYNYSNIRQITEYKFNEKDELVPSFEYPKSMDGKRLLVKYADEGGTEKDGLIEIRPGCPDLNLGNVNYAQVRILVDGTNYLKGMAVYNPDLPEGVDVLFNSGHTRAEGYDASVKPVAKNLKKDPNNPFGSAIKPDGGQYHYIDENGERQLGLINKRAEESEWGNWSKELPSQFLSKQPVPLVKQQLQLSLVDKKDELEEIMKITNPTVRKKVLEDFAGDCDTQASELKAAALPGQKYQVLLPLTSIADGECYAPQFRDGQQLALIRFPHGGTFEIPIVTVNNRNEEGKKFITPNALDAIGITKTTAMQLSGADFDGDTALVIPINQKAKIKSTPILPGLNGFDPSMAYGGVEQEDGTFLRNGMPYKMMAKKDVQKQMGMISNLITDMTVSGATDEELARAVRHSMVVIDAEKHHLDYTASERENGIAELKKKYQIRSDGHIGGAATLLSRAGAEANGVPERVEGAFFNKTNLHRVTQLENHTFRDDETGEIYKSKEVKSYPYDPKTGERVYRETGRKYYKVDYINSKGRKVTASVFTNSDGDKLYKNDKGETVKVTNEKLKEFVAPNKTSVSNMDLTKDANSLISITHSAQEQLYADYANNLKALANSARKASFAIQENTYSPAARKVYANEVMSLDAKLKEANLNAPRERQAQILASTEIKAKFEDNPGLTKEEKKKISNSAIQRARAKVGAKRVELSITDKEWEAIQAGAISTHKLTQIMNKAGDQIRALATPKQTNVPSASKINRMKALSKSGYTISEIADALGYSTSTINKYLKGEE